jgi:hypothetical protein
MGKKKLVAILAHAFVGWALCTASMGVGLAVTSVQNALVVHAVGAPVFFAGVSYVYFSKFNYTTPWQTAAIFVSFVILVDFFFVALLVQRSFEMFGSLLGTSMTSSRPQAKGLTDEPRNTLCP